MSALNLNKTELCGRLAADVELKQTTNGRSVVSFSLAVNRTRTKDSTEQKADFINCVAWDKIAEFIAKYFRKGDSLYIFGKLRVRNYKDKDGRTVYATEVYIDEAQFVDNKSATASSTPASSEPAQFEEINIDEDLPF